MFAVAELELCDLSCQLEICSDEMSIARTNFAISRALRVSMIVEVRPDRLIAYSLHFSSGPIRIQGGLKLTDGAFESALVSERLN
jgi:hypothetical protein